MKKRAIPPYKGASNAPAYVDSGQPFAPAEALNNVMPYDATKDRMRIGTRPGTSQYFHGNFGGRIQGCGVVARGKTVSGYTLGLGTELAGGSARTQGAIAGNVWSYDTVWGLKEMAYEDVTSGGPYSDTGAGTAADTSVNAVCLSRDGSKIIHGESYSDGSGNRVARVTCRSATTLAVIWSKKMSDTGIDRYVNAIACSADWVFVCTNHFIRIFKLSDGSNPTGGSTAGMNGWSQEAVDCKVDSAGTSLYVLFYGTTGGNTLDSGVTVSAGVQAAHFRSGVMKYTIATAAQIAAGTASKALTQTTLGPQLAASDRYYEGKHNYCRFSEQMPWAPRGCRPTAITLTPDGGFAVAHCNAGWGPDANPLHTIANGHPDDDYLPPNATAGYWSVSKFNSQGVHLWRADADSRTDAVDGSGFHNDLDDPTTLAITCDADGNITAGGRRTKDLPAADGTNVFSFNSSGDYLWDSDLGTTVRALEASPTGTINAGGDRSDDWPDATGHAQMWELRPTDGAIARAATDLGNVSTLGIATPTDSGPITVTDKV